MREERPEQEDLTIPDHDRTLWQMRQHRADTAQAWSAWVREQSARRIPELDRSLVPLPETSVSRLSRYRYQGHESLLEEEEGGDT